MALRRRPAWPATAAGGGSRPCRRSAPAEGSARPRRLPAPLARYVRASPRPRREPALDTAFDAVWQRFLGAVTTLGPTPGVREAWHRGRRRYAVWALRVDDPAIRARLRAMQDHLAPHGVVPFQDPHVTLFVAGFPAALPVEDDDVARAVLDAQAAALRALRAPPPRLAVGGLNAFLSCPVLEVHDPFGDLARLRAPLEALRPEIRFAPYLPHLTVGTFGDTRPTAPLAAAIAPWRGLPPLPFRPGAVELVSFDADVVGGELGTEARVPFEGGG